jgi:divalent metal cation (Fe/Co/Zn/Cd) transporter
MVYSRSDILFVDWWRERYLQIFITVGDNMGACSFIAKAVTTAGIAAAGIATLPVLGAVGAVSVAGAIVAAGIGVAAAATDEYMENKDKKKTP